MTGTHNSVTKLSNYREYKKIYIINRNKKKGRGCFLLFNATYFACRGGIYSKRFVLSINAIVASRMIRLVTTFNLLFPNRSSLHKAFESRLLISKPGISSS